MFPSILFETKCNTCGTENEFEICGKQYHSAFVMMLRSYFVSDDFVGLVCTGCHTLTSHRINAQIDIPPQGN